MIKQLILGRLRLDPRLANRLKNGGGESGNSGPNQPGFRALPSDLQLAMARVVSPPFATY